MINFTDIMTIVRFFFKQGLRGKRVKAMGGVVLIPSLVMAVLRIVEFMQVDGSVSASAQFPEFTSKFMLLLYIPLIALFYGAAVVNDEVEDKTLIFLTTSSISRGSIFIGKFIVSFLLCSAITLAGLISSFLIANAEVMFTETYMVDFIQLSAVSVLSIAAYLGVFALLGNFFKKPVLIGLAYVFAWEPGMLAIPGDTHYLTITHFVRSLMPENIGDAAMKLEQLKIPSGELVSVITLVLATLGCCALAMWVFYSKEYILADSES